MNHLLLLHACRYRRECMKDYKYEDITIPKGASIVIPSFVLHMDPTYWPEPEKFEPLRYDYKTNHACAC